MNPQPPTSFFTELEIAQLGFLRIGKGTKISRFARFYSPEKISIGDNVRIDDFCVLSGGKGITIGNHVHVGCFSSIFGSGNVTIHDFANISSRVAIFSECDDPSGRSLTNPTIPRKWKTNQTIAPVVVGKHSVLFTNCTVLPGVTIEEGAVLAAHSLAAQSISAWQIHAGVPAEFLKERVRDLLELEQQFLAEQ